MRGVEERTRGWTLMNDGDYLLRFVLRYMIHILSDKNELGSYFFLKEKKKHERRVLLRSEGSKIKLKKRVN